MTLREYYEGRIPLKQLFGRTGQVPAEAHDQKRLEEILADLGEYDPDLRKTVKLASRRSNLPRWLREWLKVIIEHEMGGVLDPEEASGGFGLRRLFLKCRGSLTDKDAQKGRRAYNRLRLSLVYVHSRRALDPIDLAEEVTRLAFPEGRSRFSGHDLERGAVSPFLRATSPSTLKKVLLSLRLWIELARTARAEAFAAREEVERLVAKIGELQKDLALERDQVHALNRRSEDSAKLTASLQEKLAAEGNRRINEIRDLKGRTQRLLDSELAPRLRGAREALDGSPAALDVALERIERTLELIEEERPWLCSD